jgi:hypothetical protein
MGTPREVRPSFYALEGGGWRDYVTLLHPPYTLWHLSYVAVGAALAPHFHLDRLGFALLAFALALGVAAHALDELHGRPLRTRIPGPTLVTLAIVSLAGAAAVGAGAAAAWGWWLLAFVIAGSIAVPAYNLELAFHSDWGFALWWGAFPAVTGYFVEAQGLHSPALAAGAYGFGLSVLQRRLSTKARSARRKLRSTAGIETTERTLRLLTAVAILLGVGFVVARLR